MDPEVSQRVMDMLRGMSVTLFCVYFAQVAYVLRHYAYVYRIDMKINGEAGLLPSHVLWVSVGTLGIAAQATLQNIIRIGEPPNYFVAFNPLFLAMLVYSMNTLMTFERLRYQRIRLDPPDLL